METPSLVPFSTYVVKVVSRCNLNCDYCYMYNLTDSTWRNQPAVMDDYVTRAFSEKVASYSKRHAIPVVHVILHGGEPLMMGKKRLARWVQEVRRIVGQTTIPLFSIQSNGSLIDQDWIETLADLDVRIGISVDGPKDVHDAHRRDHKNRGSFSSVVRAIRRLREDPRGRDIFSTVMAVVDTRLDPHELFDFWQEIDVPGFDLSLPHANHKYPPPAGPISYGDWLIQFFDCWFDQNRPDRSIRYFENIIRCLLGYPISTDNIGGRPVGVVVVETDGSIEPTDAFKCCEEGITKVGVSVLDQEFDDVQGIGLVKTLQVGRPALCDTCSSCEVVAACGGGYMPHRYSQNNGFQNPSIYCDDLSALTRHIRRKVVESMPADLVEQLVASGRMADARYGSL